jgi:hypothetical protein
MKTLLQINTNLYWPRREALDRASATIERLAA